MAGKVYIYNLFNEVAHLSLNGATAGTIGGWNDGTNYQPSCLAVASTQHEDENSGVAYRGGDGSNAVKVQWDSGTANGTIKLPTVADDVGIDEDLVVFIAKNQAFVEITEGFVKGGNQTLNFVGPS